MDLIIFGVPSCHYLLLYEKNEKIILNKCIIYDNTKMDNHKIGRFEVNEYGKEFFIEYSHNDNYIETLDKIAVQHDHINIYIIKIIGENKQIHIYDGYDYNNNIVLKYNYKKIWESNNGYSNKIKKSGDFIGLLVNLDMDLHIYILISYGIYVFKSLGKIIMFDSGNSCAEHTTEEYILGDEYGNIYVLFYPNSKFWLIIEKDKYDYNSGIEPTLEKIRDIDQCETLVKLYNVNITLPLYRIDNKNQNKNFKLINTHSELLYLSMKEFIIKINIIIDKNILKHILKLYIFNVKCYNIISQCGEAIGLVK